MLEDGFYIAAVYAAWVNPDDPYAEEPPLLVLAGLYQWELMQRAADAAADLEARFGMDTDTVTDWYDVEQFVRDYGVDTSIDTDLLSRVAAGELVEVPIR